MPALRTSFVLLALLAMLLYAGGCATHEEEVAAAPLEGSEASAQPAPAPVTAAELTAPAVQKISFLYPPGTSPQAAVARLEKTVPVEVQAGQAFDYQITVTNPTEMCLDDVMVYDRLGTGFKLTSADPQPQSSEKGKFRWDLGQFKAREMRTIKVTGTASEAGKLTHCATLTCTPQSCGEVAVVQPLLKLTRVAPEEVCICDPIAVKFTVTNAGTGWARNVIIKEALPSGLATADGKASLQMDAGALAAGKSREFQVNLMASKTGSYDSKATVAADNNLFSEALGRTTIRQPILAVTMSGPEKEFIGRPLTYQITVMNKGDAVSRETMLIGKLPAGASIVSASDDGRPASASGQVTWAIGALQPNASKQVQLTLSSPAEGLLECSAMTHDKCAVMAMASAKTTLSGIPAILLEVTDASDPIQVGRDGMYEIVATNQGSTAATRIAITCELEDTMQYVSANGPTDAQVSADGKKITFAPLASLPPKAKAIWHVMFRALKPADARFRVQMQSDQLGRPVEETEATQLFQ